MFDLCCYTIVLPWSVLQRNQNGVSSLWCRVQGGHWQPKKRSKKGNLSIIHFAQYSNVSVLSFSEVYCHQGMEKSDLFKWKWFASSTRSYQGLRAQHAWHESFLIPPNITKSSSQSTDVTSVYLFHSSLIWLHLKWIAIDEYHTLIVTAEEKNWGQQRHTIRTEWDALLL